MQAELFPLPANKRQKSTCDGEDENDDEEGEGGGRGEASAATCCGICLLQQGKAVKGEIECCDHYFCFVCILEWAKVETRCPLCKRRFATIRRPPKPGVFPSHRLVNVPRRDQVSFLHGNATVFDPYEDVRCTVCQNSGDDYLLLLCDLCDSASHTYCVGLGGTVPEGDWFCSDCAASRTQYIDSLKDCDGSVEDSKHDKVDLIGSAGQPSPTLSFYVDEQSDRPNSDVVRTAGGEFVSVYDVVHEPDCLRLGWTQNGSSNVTGSSEQAPLVDNSTGVSPGAVDKATGTKVRTVKRCRNVQRCIRSLRENWEALRSGSQRFSSCLVESTSETGGERHIDAGSCKSSGKLHSLSAMRDQPQTTKNVLPESAKQNSCRYDVDRAWKMMVRAKSVQKTCESTKGVLQAWKHPSANRNTSAEMTNGTVSLPFSASFLHAMEVSGNTKSNRHYKHHALEEETEKHIFRKVEKLPLIEDGISKCIHNTFSPGISASSSSWKAHPSSKGAVFHESWTGLVQKDLYRYSSSIDDEIKIPSSSITQVEGVIGASGSINDRRDLGTSSSTVHFFEQSDSLAKVCTRCKTQKDDDAKSMIQSLVKLNLKHLNRDKQLGVDAFKEIARLATHTILAACGLGHSRSVSFSCPGSVCCHSITMQ